MSTRGDKVFGVVAIILGVGIVTAVVVGASLSVWATIGASLLIIIWLAVVRRRPPEKRVYRTRL
jgi:hypothetical protein